MNSERCHKCHTKIDHTHTHCPVCGNGTIKIDSTMHLPDEPVDGPERILALCEAFTTRLKEPEGLMRQYYGEQLFRPRAIVAATSTKTPISDTFKQQFLATTEWTPFSNLPIITDPMRGMVYFYLHLYQRMALSHLEENGKGDQNNILSGEMERAIHFLPVIENYAEFAIGLLAEHQRILIQRGDVVDALLFTLHERYYFNAYAAGFSIMDYAVENYEYASKFGEVTPWHTLDISIGLEILSQATRAGSITNVPEEYQNAHNGMQQVRFNISWDVNSCKDALAENNLEAFMWYYKRWDRSNRDVMDRFQRMSTRMGPPCMHIIF